MSDDPLARPDLLERALALTPARVLVGRAGPAYRTGTWLRLRADHAAARDAVHAEIDLVRDFGEERIARLELFEVSTRAATKVEYLRRPDLGRRLSVEASRTIATACTKGADLQVVIGDGLSASAVALQAPELLDRLYGAATSRGWSFGRPWE